MSKKILILDPSKLVRNVLRDRLVHEQFEVHAFGTLEEGLSASRQNEYDLLLCDQSVSDKYLFSPNEGSFAGMNRIIMSADPWTRDAVYIKNGEVYHFASKPVDMNQLLSSVRNIFGKADAAMQAQTASTEEEEQEEIRVSRTENQYANTDLESIVGTSTCINHVKSLIHRVGPSEARVLITGPSGTGKELVARCLHRHSPRHDSPLVEVNCAAIPQDLIESELFGHEKGAFTSAVRQYKGKFEQASGGTLFLDEIGDMSLSAQSKVLRALQEHRISRVGGDRDIEVDVRIVAATNKNLREEIRLGNFREDLYHRLSVIIIHVPPLAERIDDIPLLANHFMEKKCSEYGISPRSMDDGAIKELQSMNWSGNIRELQNVIERIILLGDAPNVSVDDVRAFSF